MFAPDVMVSISSLARQLARPGVCKQDLEQEGLLRALLVAGKPGCGPGLLVHAAKQAMLNFLDRRSHPLGWQRDCRKPGRRLPGVVSLELLPFDPTERYVTTLGDYEANRRHKRAYKRRRKLLK